MKAISDAILFFFVGGLILFMSIFCFAAFDIFISKGLLRSVGVLTAICWVIMLFICFIDFFRRDWRDETKKDLWKNIFLQSLIARGATTVMIGYYIMVIRNKFSSDNKIEGGFQARKSISILRNLSNLLLFLFICGFFGALFGFHLKSDLLFMSSMKVAALSFFCMVIIDFPLTLITLKHMVNQHLPDDH